MAICTFVQFCPFWQEFAKQDGVEQGKIIIFVLPMTPRQGLTNIFSSPRSRQEKNLSLDGPLLSFGVDREVDQAACSTYLAAGNWSTYY